MIVIENFTNLRNSWKTFESSLTLYFALLSKLICFLFSAVASYSLLFFFSECYMNELWKALYFRITNRFYEPLATTESPGIDMKDLYFQRAFHEILQCFSEEVESSGFLSYLLCVR